MKSFNPGVFQLHRWKCMITDSEFCLPGLSINDHKTNKTHDE